MPAIMGLDVAGEIAALGPGVTGWKVGERVLGDPINRVEGGLIGETVHGGLAEYAGCARTSLCACRTASRFEQAAALPCAYGTARRMMFTNGACRGRGEGADPRRFAAGSGSAACSSPKRPAPRSSPAPERRRRRRGCARSAPTTRSTTHEQDFVQEVYALFGKPVRRGAGTDNGVDVVVNYTGGDTWTKCCACCGSAGGC